MRSRSKQTGNMRGPVKKYDLRKEKLGGDADLWKLSEDACGQWKV